VTATKRLTKRLRPSRIFVHKDLKHSLRIVHALRVRQQDRIKWIMTSTKMREWLTSTRSRVLLINGNTDATELESPTTFLAGKFLEAVESMQSVISMYYFCSFHRSSSDEPGADGIGMLRCLLVQLLEARKAWILPFANDEDLEDFDCYDIEATCKLFHELLQKLPKDTVLFCVIDAINFYERDDKREDFLSVIDHLVWEVEQATTITIKLLFTCPSRSAFVKDFVGDEDILNVPESVDGDGQGWSNFTWQRTTGREITKWKETRDEPNEKMKGSNVL
jgi:hypothetical protein